ncbi:MAG: DUF4190 domain-containing protein, partial [Gemmataceae bacterium]
DDDRDRDRDRDRKSSRSDSRRNRFRRDEDDDDRDDDDDDFDDRPRPRRRSRKPQGDTSMGTFSLVAGIASCVLSFCCIFISVPASVLGLVLGFLSLKTPGRPQGIAGIVLSLLGLALMAIVFFLSLGVNLMNDRGNNRNRNNNWNQQNNGWQNPAFEPPRPDPWNR